jgi:predicted anti-sigma-YlaC factor YlaD
MACGCSIRGIATKSLADTFSGSGGGYASDDDPELVRDAVPFALKTMEQILEDQPHHVGLLTALAKNFTQYGYAFVQQDADRMEDKDLAASKALTVRARRLYLRGRDYGLRGLSERHAGFREAFQGGTAADQGKLLSACTKEDAELLYWTGASWALAVGAGKDQMKLVGELPLVEAIMARALALDEGFGDGSIHEFYVAYDGARSENEGGGEAKARAHRDRALALSKNRHLAPIVSYAEAVCVQKQDKKEFVRLLEGVVAFDVDKYPADRLANLVNQRRARWLLGRVNDLFAE